MSRYIAFDVETPNHRNDRMSAIGISVIEDGVIRAEFSSLIDPETYFDSFNIALTGITPGAAAAAPTFEELWPRIRPMMEDGILLAHNAPFDLSVLGKCLQAYGISWHRQVPYACTCRMARRCCPELVNHKLDTLCRHYEIPLQHHAAGSDSHACAQLFLSMGAGEKALDACLRSYDLLLLCTRSSPDFHRCRR